MLVFPVAFSIHAVIAGALGALLYRLRGGALIDLGGAFRARLAWAVPTGLFAGLLSGDPVVLVVTVVAAEIALRSPHAAWWDVGHDHGSAGVDAVMMTALGFYRFGLMSVPSLVFLWSGNALFVLLIAPLHAGFYWTARKIPVPTRWRATPRHLVDNNPAYAELAWGCTQWIALAACYAATTRLPFAWS